VKSCTPTKAELLRELAAASKTSIELVKLCERLIDKLRSLRYASAQDESAFATSAIRRIRNGGTLDRK
jgi:hypothetical protein